MGNIETLNHTKWHCKYHVVFIPKGRRKVLYGQLRCILERYFARLAQHKESWIEEGHLMADHVHMMIAIPPKYAVCNLLGYIKREVRFTWPGCMGSARGILQGKASGLVGALCRP